MMNCAPFSPFSQQFGAGKSKSHIVRIRVFVEMSRKIRCRSQESLKPPNLPNVIVGEAIAEMSRKIWPDNQKGHCRVI
jgi:hypothetical protein